MGWLDNLLNRLFPKNPFGRERLHEDAGSPHAASLPRAMSMSSSAYHPMHRTIPINEHVPGAASPFKVRQLSLFRRDWELGSMVG
jgi:hypothetical protein